MNNNIFPYNDYSFQNEDLFVNLSASVYKVLLENSTVAYVKAGETVFKEGDIPKGIYRVKEGKVKKFKATNFRAEHLFYICKEQEYLGYHALLSEEVYQDSAVALTDCKIEFILKHDFLKTVNSSHQVSQHLLKCLSHEFAVLLNAAKLLAKYTVRERTAINLLILNNKFSVEDTLMTEIVINRDDLANMVGTATESLVRMLKEFKEDKLISTKGRSIFIKNKQGLLEVTNTM
jgi:CRP-like cAMP-binding protein